MINHSFFFALIPFLGFSSVLGDAFHFMDRPKAPVHRSSKKAYFVALRRAWYVFEPKVYAALVAALKADGLTDAEIEARGYCDFAYFRRRVPRLAPPPSQHYKRVRAVYALYGLQVDTKSGSPLFNKKARAKANNVLAEILDGSAADPPGIQFYLQSPVVVPVSPLGQQAVRHLDAGDPGTKGRGGLLVPDLGVIRAAIAVQKRKALLVEGRPALGILVRASSPSPPSTSARTK